ncbi:MAG TPA: flagellar export protein FliJ [Candidatus Krumholzibacteria bacterium]|nr:flagellar export protein FliJ [Candidatus Krumholzibacteria bacterium]HPD71626.1 flagellar export protein FliJ [Candidatus Krumholzibacteria bacterium]HRY41441.1 flagellar export protein FliJ [Candidatus Krumholzibacteria bacterium]
MFRFRLEKVLDHRQRELDARTLAVAQARAVVAAATRDVADANRELTQARLEAVAAREGRVDPVELARLLAWQERLVGRKRQLEAKLVAGRQALVLAQERLQQAWREREMLTRLRERQRLEWEQEEARRERRALDEIGAVRAALVRRDRRSRPEA